MANESKLIVYLTKLSELKELQSENSMYKDVSVEIRSLVYPLAPQTKIAETWHNGSPEEHFSRREFCFGRIDDINKKLYQKIWYQKSKLKEKTADEKQEAQQ